MKEKIKIGITGDMHGDLYFEQVYKAKRQGFNHLIVCGDFGYIWYGNKKEQRQLDYLNKIGVKILFIDGNHENHKLLNSCEKSIMFGGRVHKIRENIIHLMRGEIYTIDNKKIFAFGGANSTDKKFRKIDTSWWAEEKPTIIDYNNAFIRIFRNNYDVDFVITHTSYTTALKQLNRDDRVDSISEMLETIREKLDFKYWFFGHMHENTNIPELKTMCLYNDVIELKSYE